PCKITVVEKKYSGSFCACNSGTRFKYTGRSGYVDSISRIIRHCLYRRRNVRIRRILLVESSDHKTIAMDSAACVGAVYNRAGTYLSSFIPRCYDAVLYFEKVRAVRRLLF
ncbi:MAG TPA: hypothetical protein VM012_10290, partial [Flavitalea sp.]|nr:hypothetical protein [Flavitalea sp.]